MKNLSISALERYIYDVLFDAHLPDQDLTSRTNEVNFTNCLCNAINDLRRKGKIKMYKKDSEIYHFVCN